MDKVFKVLIYLVAFLVGFIIMRIIEKSLYRRKIRIEDHDYKFSEIDEED